MSKTYSASILSLALAAAFSAPAFAQDAATTQSKEAAPTAQSQEQAAPTQTASDASAAAPEANSEKKSWSDLDVDKNGTLSATEAATMQSLSKIFPQADADANGELAPDEYKAWLSANGKPATPAK